MAIQRYAIGASYDTWGANAEPDDAGDWVRYEDTEAALLVVEAAKAWRNSSIRGGKLEEELLDALDRFDDRSAR